MDKIDAHFTEHFKMQLKCTQNALQNDVWKTWFKMHAFQNGQI